MPPSRAKIIITLLTLSFIFSVIAGYKSYEHAPVPKPPPTNPKTYPTPHKESTISAKIISVTDGDTVSVTVNGNIYKVRIIGIDTPETVDPRKPVECFGNAASSRARKILTDKNVILESDPTQDDTDKYGRLLRFIWINGKDYGLSTITEGYAYEYTYHTPYLYQGVYQAAEKQARREKKGLWADDACPQPSL